MSLTHGDRVFVGWDREYKSAVVLAVWERAWHTDDFEPIRSIKMVRLRFDDGRECDVRLSHISTFSQPDGVDFYVWGKKRGRTYDNDGFCVAGETPRSGG